MYLLSQVVGGPPSHPCSSTRLKVHGALRMESANHQSSTGELTAISRMSLSHRIPSVITAIIVLQLVLPVVVPLSRKSPPTFTQLGFHGTGIPCNRSRLRWKIVVYYKFFQRILYMPTFPSRPTEPARVKRKSSISRLAITASSRS